jgi:hypothetical protein
MDFYSQFMSPVKEEYPLSGAYYYRKPLLNTDIAEPMNYKVVDANVRRYGEVIANLKKEEQYNIRQTNTQCNFRIGGHIATQDGILWQITEIQTKAVQEYNQAFRLFKASQMTAHILRLVAVDNPLGLTADGV